MHPHFFRKESFQTKIVLQLLSYTDGFLQLLLTALSKKFFLSPLLPLPLLFLQNKKYDMQQKYIHTKRQPVNILSYHFHYQSLQ